MAISAILRLAGRFAGRGAKATGRLAKKTTGKIAGAATTLGSVAMLAKDFFGKNDEENQIEKTGSNVSDLAQKTTSSTDGAVSENSINLAKSLKIYSIGLQNAVSNSQDAKGRETPISQTPVIPSIVPPSVDAAPQSGFAQFVQQEAKILNSVRENEEARIRASETSRNNDPLGLLLKGIQSSAAQLEDNSAGNISDAKKENLEAKRENEEKRLEGGMFSDAMENVFGKVKDFARNTRKGLLATLTPFATAAGLMASGLLLDTAAGAMGDEEGEDGDEEELMVEDVLDTVDKTAETITQIAAPAIIRNTALGAKTAISGKIDKINSNKLGAATLRGGKAAGKATANIALKMTAKVKPTSGRYQKIVQNLTKAKNWMVKTGQSFNKTTANVQAAVQKLPRPIQVILGRVGKFAFRWFMFVEIIDFLWRSTQSVIMGSITKEEWHKGNKEQLYKLIRLFGAPIVGMIILGLAGTPIMGLGGIAGAAAGLILGVILGESLFYAINMEALVNGFYDAFFLGKWSTLIGYAPALVKRLMVELPMLLGEAAMGLVRTAISTSPVVLAIKATRDEIASDEDIAAEYGEGISNAELLQKAGEGIGTDENAILYAFKDIDTPEKYIALKNEFEETALPKINEGRIRKFNTMEQYIRKELSGGEYKQLMQQVTTQMQENNANESDALKQFFDDVGYEYEEPPEEMPEQTIPGIDDATAEQIELYNRGELVDVIVDGKKVLMTREELREADVPRVFKTEARREADMRRRRYQEGQSIQPETDGEETPVTNLDRTAEDLQGTNNYLRDMAARMGLETSGEITGKLIGGVPVEINGRRVPNSLYTNEERQKIRAAEEARQAMDPVTPRQQRQPETKSEPPPNIIPAAGRTAGTVNLLTQNIAQQQRAQTMPFGSMAPTESIPATPTRQTNDSFIDLGYVT